MKLKVICSKGVTGCELGIGIMKMTTNLVHSNLSEEVKWILH